jgi:hypothetical protein
MLKAVCLRLCRNHPVVKGEGFQGSVMCDVIGFLGAWSGNHEIQIFFSARFEVPHGVVHAKYDFALCDMPLQQRAGAQ